MTWSCRLPECQDLAVIKVAFDTAISEELVELKDRKGSPLPKSETQNQGPEVSLHCLN